jgi:alpha-L-rhamnosidase
VPGFRRVILRPEPVGDLSFVEAESRSMAGTIRTRWDRGPQGLRLAVEIPANVTGRLWLPAPDGARILEGEKPVEEAPGVRALERKPAHAVFDLESGRYVFEVK